LDEGDVIFDKFIGEFFIKMEADFDIIISVAEFFEIIVIICDHCLMYKQCYIMRLDLRRLKKGIGKRLKKESYIEKVLENGKIGNEIIHQKKLIDSIHDQNHGLIYEGSLNV